MAEKSKAQEGRIEIVVDGEVFEAWDASHLTEEERGKIASRIIHYANSQTMGLKREKRRL